MKSPKPNRKGQDDGLATLDEARKATIPAGRLGGVRDFWPGFAASVRRDGEKASGRSGARPGWRWALGTAGLLAVIGTVILVPTLTRRETSPAAPVDRPLPFRVDSVAIEEKPAQAFVFHTQDPDITYIWVERQL